MAVSNLQVYPLRLKPGDELKSCLLKFVKEYDLKAAFVLTCCGSVSKATLRLAKPKSGTESERVKTFNQYFEILSLTGTLSGDGHLHVSLGDEDGMVHGGHVMGDMVVQTTAEVVIGECTDTVFKREFDPATGYDELTITKA